MIGTRNGFVIATAKTSGGVYRQIFARYRKEIEKDPIEFWLGIKITKGN